MAEFLTDAWIRELDDSAGAIRVSTDLQLTVEQVVVDVIGSEICYVIRICDGRVSVTSGRADLPDITLTQDRPTAAAIARGELSAQTAFMDGRLRIGGDLRSVVRKALELSALADVFAAARDATTW